MRQKIQIALIVSAAVIVLMAGFSLYSWRTDSVNWLVTPKDDPYYVHTYTKPSQKDECVADYYRAHPEALPENQKPGYIYLPPPCPGIPQ